MNAVLMMEPTAVVGNEGESDSGSLRAPQAQERANMTVVEAVPKDEIGLLVEKWQSAEGQAKNRIGNEIFRRLDPQLRSVMKRFVDQGVQEDDLYQVAALAVVRLMHKPLRVKYTFAEIAYLKARDALREHVAAQGADVHVSDWARRSRSNVQGKETVKRGKSHVAVQVESSDDKTEHRDAATLEHLTTAADRKLYAALARLTPHKREVIRSNFGIDLSDEESIRSMSKRLGVPRVKLTRVIEEALADLRDIMEPEPCP